MSSWSADYWFDREEAEGELAMRRGPTPEEAAELCRLERLATGRVRPTFYPAGSQDDEP